MAGIRRLALSHRHLSFILLLSTYSVYAQTSSLDSMFIQQMKDSVISLYHQSLGEDILLYNGREYVAPYSRSVGHRYFASEHPQKGYIVYSNILYPHSAVSYDLTTDDVIIRTTGNRSIKLLGEKISYFSLGDAIFIRLSQQPDKINVPSTGFYQVLYNGGITVLVKRRKQLEPVFNLEDPYRFVSYDRYFTKKGDVYREIDSESSLINSFPNKTEMRKYMRNQGLSFKKNRERAIVQVAAYYDQTQKP